MTEEQPVVPGMAFWIIGAVALLWNLLGLYAYYSNVTAKPEDLMLQFNPEQIEAILATPAWATSATAIAVTAGVIGSMLLLFRNSLCVPFFALSVVGVVVQDIYIFGMTDAIEMFGNTPIIMQTIVFVFAVFLVWYAQRQKKLGVVR